MSGKPLDQLLSRTDPEGCHVINLPSRIWVFGGLIKTGPSPPETLRDTFWRAVFDRFPTLDWFKHLERPEDYEGWLEFSGYDNLLEFERDACYLARAVILFSESPGSFAELGALAIDEFMLPQLHVVVQSTYVAGSNQKSFLNLGPLRRVEEKNGLCGINVSAYPCLETHELETILESVTSWLTPQRQREKFNSANPTHRLLLIADLTDLLLVSKEEELHQALEHFGVKIGTSELRRSLQLLSFFEHLVRPLNGRRRFLVRHPKSEGPWIDYTGQAPHVFVRPKFKLSTQEFVQSDAARWAIFQEAQKR